MKTNDWFWSYCRYFFRHQITNMFLKLLQLKNFQEVGLIQVLFNVFLSFVLCEILMLESLNLETVNFFNGSIISSFYKVYYITWIHSLADRNALFASKVTTQSFFSLWYTLGCLSTFSLIFVELKSCFGYDFLLLNSWSFLRFIKVLTTSFALAVITMW